MQVFTEYTQCGFSQTARARAVTAGCSHRSSWRRGLMVLMGLVVIAGICSAGEVESGRTAEPRVVSTDLRSMPAIDLASAAVKIPAAQTHVTDDAVTAPVEPDDFRDPLVNAQQVAAAKAVSLMSVGLNVAGIDFTGAMPADAVGEAGSGHFVQMVNAPGGSVFAVYSTASGEMLAGPSKLDGLWQGAGACAEGWGHPNVVHDALADRWVLSELGAGNHLCVYVSQTADPVSGGWFAYDFALPKFPDFARIGVWADGYSVATNEDLPAVYALERSAMLSGAPAGWQRFTVTSLKGFGFQALAPADLDGDEPPTAGTGALFVRHADGQAHGGSDRVEVFELDINWGSPENSSLSGPVVLATAPFDSSLCGFAVRECVPQPGSDVRLDPMREVLTGAVRYRNFASHESLVGTFAVDTDGSNRAGIRWFELRRSGGAWSLHQEGTFSPDDSHRWIGSAAMDNEGNLALAFNVGDGSSTFPSIRVTGREGADSPGLMTVSETEIQAGTSAQTAGHSPENWGASNTLSVDPDDDCTFWTTAAYAEEGTWNTRIASFSFPSCATEATDMIFADGVETGNLEMWSSTTP